VIVKEFIPRSGEYPEKHLHDIYITRVLPSRDDLIYYIENLRTSFDIIKYRRSKMYNRKINTKDDIFFVVNDDYEIYRMERPEEWTLHESNSRRVGYCALTGINLEHGNAEFSIAISNGHYRKGFARDALLDLFEYSFKNLRINTIWGETWNPAARKLFEKVGMTCDGKRRQMYYVNGKYEDAYIYTITRADYVGKNHPDN
jgi:RimJ/RimL family protein N-acetyltransferase